MTMIHLKIDGIPVEVEKGTTILAAAEKIGIKIPTLCHIKGLLPDGSCRICVVEIFSRGRSRRTARTSHPAATARLNTSRTKSDMVVHLL